MTESQKTNPETTLIGRKQSEREQVVAQINQLDQQANGLQQQLQQLGQQRQVAISQLLKLEGAIEALAEAAS